MAAKMLKKITDKLTRYVCEKETKKFSNLFTNEGIYHDYIYGNFKGRKAIELMLNEYFYRDAENFIWKMYDHTYKDSLGYARYRFSFVSKIPKYTGKKVVISGMSFFKLQKDKIAEYHEAINGGLAMVQLGISPTKMENTFKKWFKRSLNDDPELKLLK